MQKRASIFFIICISGIFLAMMMFDFLNEDRIFSSSENRMLAKRPKLTFSAVMDKTYMTDYESGEVKAFPPFESSYICRGVLPQQLVFEELDKSIIAL